MMLTPHHILSIFTFLPLSLTLTLSPSFAAALSTHDLSQPQPRQLTPPPPGWLPRRPQQRAAKRDLHAPPELRVGGVALQVHARRKPDPTLGKRAGNGTIIPLGSLLNTYILPLSIGSPPTSYPLQLDLASSDILLATTLCASNCPASTSSNPYYDVAHASSGFVAVDGNTTAWHSQYGDGRVAQGVVARETVVVGDELVPGQVFGMINATNLTLSEQQISGILGLGFPRLSTLARALLHDASGDASSSSAAPFASSSTTSSPSATASSAYLPTLLESLVTTPHLPYPVFALALAPPPSNRTSTSTDTSSGPSPSASSRYGLHTGSLTFGGVSNLYISTNVSSGRTIDDIEWHEVMPFGPIVEHVNATAEAAKAAQTGVFSGTASASAAVSSTPAKRRDVVHIRRAESVPTTPDQLEAEQYLYWALPLTKVAVNGTNVPLNSTYSSLDIPSVALLDAGSNGIYGPQQDVSELFGLITDARQVSEGRWAVPCNTEMTLGFSFGGRYVQLQPSDWMYAQVSDSSFCLAWPVAVPSTGDGIDWQLGTPFLRNVYSIFSYGINGVQSPLVGFLPIADSPPASTSDSPTSTSSEPIYTIQTDTRLHTSSSSSSLNPAAPTRVVPASLTTTLTTTLPNVVLPSPTFPTASYVFSADPSSLTPGVLQYTGLANASAYAVGQVSVVSVGNMSTVGGGGAAVSGTDGAGGSNAGAGGDGKTSGAGRGLWIGGQMGIACAAGLLIGGLLWA